MNPLIRAAATLLVCLVAAGAQAQTAFYEAAPAELPGLPGSIIRSERMAFGPIGGDAWRLLYRSTDPGRRPIVVSGVVVLPHGATPPGGRPIVAWGHPTTGVVPACAPSLAHFVFQQMSGLRQFIDVGYIVAATDYPGLGTPGPHPFLDGASEGRAVLDMIRATKAFLGPQAGSRAALWGHSQGGQAVLFAAELAPHYAPELDLAGVAAAAPATDLAALMHDDLGTGGGDNLLAMTLWSWSRLHDLPLAGVVIPSAVPAMDALADICLESPVDILPRRSLCEQLEKGFLADPDF
ncbi:MAG: lipase, partial [Rhizobiales bacterium]|nr:lipase [Hyphomicrobiales bacterium]